MSKTKNRQRINAEGETLFGIVVVGESGGGLKPFHRFNLRTSPAYRSSLHSHVFRILTREN
jgi:hypothetical protein